MTRKFFFNIIILTILISCEPEELPLDLEGVINSVQVDIGADYCYQKYYNIDENIVVGENLITDWDLAFHNTENAIRLNSAKRMRAIYVDDPFIYDDNFADFYSTIFPLFEIGYDHPNGSIDLLAFNNEQQDLFKGFFVLDNGYDCNGYQLGYSLINIIDYNDNKYLIQVFNNNSSVFQEIEILKTDNGDYTYFSLTNNAINSIANFDWDLCFTQYTEFNVPAPGNSDNTGVYLLRGVLQNSHVSVAIDTIHSFSAITMNLISDYIFSFNSNIIGWDWKEYDSAQDLYIVDSPVYVIKTSDNDYYKLLFLDYYNDNGDKGAPMFQIEKL